MKLRKHSFELALVLMVSLGASAIYSVISLLRKITSSVGLAGSVTTINQPMAQNPWIDLISQLASISLGLVPPLLALYFLRLDAISIGLIPKWRDLWLVLAMAAGVGIPGIGLYFLALNLGLTSMIVPNALNPNWWTIPVLLLAAIKAGFLEEVIVVGYFYRKLELIAPKLAWVWIVILSALLRGSYHLYQGPSAFIGNFLMGLVFGYIFHRTKRVAPLVIAHAVMDAVVFIGYPLVFGA
ncbi:MAG: CPBP family intramembrane metalloprotease [Aquiluna sp.]|nr:CPBP family intramembrane metalloprotease [Aquiluna sp.]MCF8545549.1 CPBP family intramembrane metalloprotease [Aquiluna sp.]